MQCKLAYCTGAFASSCRRYSARKGSEDAVVRCWSLTAVPSAQQLAPCPHSAILTPPACSTTGMQHMPSTSATHVYFRPQSDQHWLCNSPLWALGKAYRAKPLLFPPILTTGREHQTKRAETKRAAAKPPVCCTNIRPPFLSQPQRPHKVCILHATHVHRETPRPVPTHR